MNTDASSVSADDLHTASKQAASWDDAIRRAQHGDTVAVVAGGQHVADVVPSGRLESLRETVDVLSDSETVAAIREGLADVAAGRVVSAEQVRADLESRRTGQ